MHKIEHAGSCGEERKEGRHGVSKTIRTLGIGYSDWLTTTRACYESTYVLAVTNPAWTKLDDIPHSERIGATMGASADFRLAASLLAAKSEKRWQRFQMANGRAALVALVDDSVGSALAWARSLRAYKSTNPIYAGIRTIWTEPLPSSKIGVGATILTIQTILRSSVDQAITSLATDGTLDAVLAERKFPGSAAP